MASFIISTLTLALIGAPSASAAASVVRRENTGKYATNSAGQIYSLVRAHQQDNNNVRPAYDGDDKDVGDADSDIDFCNYDFPLGEDMTSNCTAEGEEMILDMAECKQAAVMAGAKTNDDFEVRYDWYNKHPEGCFKDECKDGKSVCYFFNPSPTLPTALESGQPVCKRPKLINGTANTNGECKTGYQPIEDEAQCMEFGSCLGHCIGSEFRINIKNASLYNQYPKFCFIKEEDGCVYFNEPREGMPDPAGPVGMPLCNVSSVTSFKGAKAKEEKKDGPKGGEDDKKDKKDDGDKKDDKKDDDKKDEKKDGGGEDKKDDKEDKKGKDGEDGKKDK